MFIANFITVNALPSVSANALPATSVCAGDMITLSGNGASSYSWDNAVTDAVAFSATITTLYTVTGTDVNGCQNTDTITIFVNPCAFPPVVNLTASSTTICLNDCVDFTDLSSGGTPTNWTWYLFGANPLTSNSQDPLNVCYDSIGTFDVALFVSNAFGSDSIYINNYITVDSCIAPAQDSLIIPNIFSPNGDGQNDLFTVSGTFSDFEMIIYNRWGELLFKSTQSTRGWDGRTTSGTLTSEGTYFYIITADNETYKGTLTLIR